jgi:ribosome-binding factor A
MPLPKRSEHLERSLLREINNIIYRKINDPRIKFVTITRVKVSPDLKYADIFVTIFNDRKQQKKALEGLENATKFIRGELGKDLKIRYVPNIKFIIDKELEHQYKLLKIINEINDQQLDLKKDKNNEQS